MAPSTPLAELADRIDAALPQTQCRRCGYAGCRPYAEAIARGEAPINRCPPGGEAGVHTLAHITGRPVVPLDPACGAPTPPRVARIDEDVCIGCTKCIQACPVDAIVGIGKLMHTVVADLCTGCQLCVEPCPVDCIAMVPATETLAPAQARTRFLARNERLARAPTARANTRHPTPTSADPLSGQCISRTAVLAAIARGRARKQSRHRDAT